MWRAESQASNSMNFEIKHDPNAGYHLYVFENGKCIRDYQQYTLELAILDYDVPKDIWRNASCD
jgi:hypothetical protein